MNTQQLIELIKLIGNDTTNTLKPFIGEEVIIRTYSAGVWFGILAEKANNEVIINSARRLWYWKAKKSISLSAVANYGVIQDQCKFAPKVDSVWLEAIEIIPCTATAINSIEGTPDVVTK